MKKEDQKKIADDNKEFLKELKRFRQNYSMYGVIEKLPGGYALRLDNSQYGKNPKRSPFGYFGFFK